MTLAVTTCSILREKVADELENCIRAFSEQQGCDVVELNVQADHVRLLVFVPRRCRFRDISEQGIVYSLIYNKEEG